MTEDEKKLAKKISEKLDNLYDKIMTKEKMEEINTNCRIFLDTIIQEIVDDLKKHPEDISFFEKEKCMEMAIKTMINGYITEYHKELSKVHLRSILSMVLERKEEPINLH